MKLSLPENIHSIISIINNGGYKAHAVGGCVRDMLLSREPKDWDITTDAAPEEIKRLFPRTYDTGLKHGTVTVSFNGSLVEVTTWRREARYSDHRRPDRVIFTESLKEDLLRRDFCMNAMAYHPNEGLIDPYDGAGDIENRIIRCVGDPYKRFSEDALRMLRAVRFSSQLDFSIEENTLGAIKVLSRDISYVSMERIQAEVNKILESGLPERLELLWETGLSAYIFPDMASLPPVWRLICPKVSGLPGAGVMLLGFLFVFSFAQNPEERAKAMLKRLKYDSGTQTAVFLLIQGLSGLKTITLRNTRRLVTEYGADLAHKILTMHHALEGTAQAFSETELQRDLIKPAVSGLDLNRAGLGEGPEIGILLSVLKACLYENPQLNDFQTLILMAHKIRHKFAQKGPHIM